MTGWSRVVWLIRRLRPDRNPLRRRADRLEAALTGTLLVGLLAGAPLAAMSVGAWENAVSRGIVRAQAGWHTVSAVLVHNAPRRVAALSHPAVSPAVLARWTVPGGAHRTGRVYAPPGSRAGAMVRIWTDRAGRLVSEPLRKADVASRSALAAVLAVLATVIVVLASWLLIRRVLDRHRLAAWDMGWAQTGPQWTGHC